MPTSARTSTRQQPGQRSSNVSREQVLRYLTGHSVPPATAAHYLDVAQSYEREYGGIGFNHVVAAVGAEAHRPYELARAPVTFVHDVTALTQVSYAVGHPWTRFECGEMENFLRLYCRFYERRRPRPFLSPAMGASVIRAAVEAGRRDIAEALIVIFKCPVYLRDIPVMTEDWVDLGGWQLTIERVRNEHYDMYMFEDDDEASSILIDRTRAIHQVFATRPELSHLPPLLFPRWDPTFVARLLKSLAAAEEWPGRLRFDGLDCNRPEVVLALFDDALEGIERRSEWADAMWLEYDRRSNNTTGESAPNASEPTTERSPEVKTAEEVNAAPKAKSAGKAKAAPKAKSAGKAKAAPKAKAVPKAKSAGKAKAATNAKAAPKNCKNA